MHILDKSQQALLIQRAQQFEGQVQRFVAHELDPDLFQQLRLRNGLYMERHAPMLRVAIPYGVLYSDQLRQLAHIATTYDKGYGHFTTRQNIQFNWVSLEDSPKVLSELANVGMHAVQTSGSCIRNISSDHLAGVATDEIADPRPWCELIHRWAQLHPEFNWLPRKFKIAVNGANTDRAAVRLHDIGLQITRADDNDTWFTLYVGGGMGRTPYLAQTLINDLPGRKLLPWLQAIIRVYNLNGRRDHKYRSRIKILLADMGLAAFRDAVNAELSRAEYATPPDQNLLSELQAKFAAPARHNSASKIQHIPGDIAVNHPGFCQWRENNVLPHRLSGKAIVALPLKSANQAAGNLSAAQMTALADLADQYSEGELRVSHRQNLVLPHVSVDALFSLWRQLNATNLAPPVHDQLADLIACPGYDYCSLANTTTRDVAAAIRKRCQSLSNAHALGPISLKISGCMNACGHHHIADIGILGVDKKGAQWYQILLGGRMQAPAKLGERIGRALPKDQLADAVAKIIDTYLGLRHPDETLADCLLRVGIEPFKKLIYEN